MDRNRVRIFVLFVMAGSLLSGANATEPPARGAAWPDKELAERLRTFTTKRGFISLTRTVAANQAALNVGLITPDEAVAKGGIAISGRKSIPVILLKFKDTKDDPYAASELQKKLFGSWPTGTMSDFYREISYGSLHVQGTVSPWHATSQTGAIYTGPIIDGKPCSGLCSKSKLELLLKEGLDLANKSIDFSKYDNNGADGIPNSDDDDGYVDFVAFVHPGKGGECKSETEINNNIWSHRYRFSNLMGKDYETKDISKDGRRIRIDDYVIMPAFACDGTSMIDIGVFSHEFGHAFGLPDLYDTSEVKKSQGVGTWDLMGAGSWGGDDQSPHRPSHMSAWSKNFLGWTRPQVVSADLPNAKLRPAEKFADALRVNISNDIYYLVEYRTKTGFDDSLTGEGLLVWRVNEAVVRVGLLNNSVNADVDNLGVALIQADGARDLEDVKLENRGDAGDPFPGTSNKRNIDNTTNPATVGTFSLCNIRLSQQFASFDVRLTGRCP